MAVLLANHVRPLKPRTVPRILFLTDEQRTPDPAAAIAALPPGAGVIFRHYGARNRAALAQRLAAACRARGAVFLVAADWRLAAHVRADGLHLPEHGARALASGARLWRKQRRGLLTVAAHDARALRQARALAADGALLSPIHPTDSHPGRRALGPRRGALMARAAQVPVLALGGVSPRHLPQLRAAGFAGIAGIGFAVRS